MDFISEKTFEMVHTRSNMQLDDLNFKPHGGNILRYVIYLSIGARFYLPTGYEH